MRHTLAEQSVLATIIYYDLLDIALTKGDIVCTLVNIGMNAGTISEENIAEALGTLQEKNIISQLHNRYTLRDREYLVPLREGYVRIAHKKLARLKKIVWWLQYMPYLESVFASGSLALLHTNELSDLDVLMVVNQGRIWTARFFITAVCEFLGVRRTKFHIRAPDKICLNHYITDIHLRIPYESLFNAQTYINLIPIYIRGGITKAYFLKENIWLNKYIAHPEYFYASSPLLSKNRFASALATFSTNVLNTFIGDRIEQWLKLYQQRRIVRDGDAIEEGSAVSDNALSFHPGSPEQEITERFRRALQKFSVE